MAVVAENVLPDEPWNRTPAVEIAAGHGCSDLRQCGRADIDSDVRVLRDGSAERQAAVRRGSIMVESALLDPPAVVPAGDDDVNLFDLVLAYIALEKAAAPTGPVVERKAPGVAHAERVDLFAHAAAHAHERIRCRDAILSAGAIGAQRVDAQDFGEEFRLILRVAEHPGRSGRGCAASARVAVLVVMLAPAVADADVEEAVGAKLKLAAVVVRLRLVKGQDDPLADAAPRIITHMNDDQADPLRIGIRHIGVERGDLKLGDRGAAVHRIGVGRRGRIRRRRAVENVKLAEAGQRQVVAVLPVEIWVEGEP